MIDGVESAMLGDRNGYRRNVRRYRGTGLCNVVEVSKGVPTVNITKERVIFIDRILEAMSHEYTRSIVTASARYIRCPMNAKLQSCRHDGWLRSVQRGATFDHTEHKSVFNLCSFLVHAFLPRLQVGVGSTSSVLIRKQPPGHWAVSTERADRCYHLLWLKQ